MERLQESLQLYINLLMTKLIACCGLDCAVCDARTATLRNDDELRKATAAKWQTLYNVPEIPYQTINCTGCLSPGIKFAHCDECAIRNCVKAKGYETCGQCADLESCDLLAEVIRHVPEALANLRQLN